MGCATVAFTEMCFCCTILLHYFAANSVGFVTVGFKTVGFIVIGFPFHYRAWALLLRHKAFNTVVCNSWLCYCSLQSKSFSRLTVECNTVGFDFVSVTIVGVILVVSSTVGNDLKIYFLQRCTN